MSMVLPCAIQLRCAALLQRCVHLFNVLVAIRIGAAQDKQTRWELHPGLVLVMPSQHGQRVPRLLLLLFATIQTHEAINHRQLLRDALPNRTMVIVKQPRIRLLQYRRHAELMQQVQIL
eukprot:CAMPEP_0198126834 /NCGR_PEP_ID=MMETSP1442-20131203/45853_1 /TAXON_ID= /ORGANISM="Craspedostauros australis, Strain CCMP3328" /LENGTH=118 /DNA_ID=CAMNT_0043786719 /DNA_START=166 /DNA_END=519 /DNA_ORIENTATION=+